MEVGSVSHHRCPPIFAAQTAIKRAMMDADKVRLFSVKIDVFFGGFGSGLR